MTDNDLLYQLKTGNKEAFAELLTMHRKTVLDICKHFLLSKEDAENVSRNVFVEVYNTARNFRGSAKLPIWIYRIAISKSLAQINKRKRNKLFTAWGKAIGLDRFNDWFSDNEMPNKTTEEQDDIPMLCEALNRLPHKQRIAVTLSKTENFSNRSIAEIMDISLREADRLIYLGHQNVKLILDEQLSNSIAESAEHSLIWNEEGNYLKGSTL